MKIDNDKTLVELTNYLRGIERKPQKQEIPASDVDADRTKTDRVEISRRSKEIQKVREVVEAVPDVRTDKVRELKESVESDRYNVKGEAVAENIIKRSLIDAVL